MSRAFMRESDDQPERPLSAPRPSALPPGAQNYITPDGARRFQEELERLAQERQRRSAMPEELRELNLRIGYLQRLLESAVVTPPPPPAEKDQVRFGAAVMVRERSGEESCYRIVGVDEVDIDRGWVSWLSPIAKAMLNARLGERVRFKSPSGEQELMIVAINYEQVM
ncbi:MAG: GreA/GreB family elongation factor [Verrucomicrobiia bacterium]